MPLAKRQAYPWVRSRTSACHAIWIASSLASFDFAGSSLKPGSSITYLCRSVKRTASGSSLGWISESRIPMSSGSLQVSSFGIVTPLFVFRCSLSQLHFRSSAEQSQTANDQQRIANSWFSVLFGYVIPVPRRDFHDQFARLLDYGLASEARV